MSRPDTGRRFGPGPEALDVLNISPVRPCYSSRLWAPEIISLLAGIGCFITVFVLFIISDGKPSSTWLLGISLNSIVAFFVSLARLTFMVPVIEGLGQLKWTRFSNQPRSLREFELIDNASRGLFGSLNLLIRLKGLLACLGALITISGILTSTITQEAINYVPAQVAVANVTASVPVARHLSFWDGNNLAVPGGDTIREKLAVLEGAYTVLGENVSFLAPSCPSGECEWPAYGTLALCTTVANLSAGVPAEALEGVRNAAAESLANLYASTLATQGQLLDHQNVSAELFLPLVIGPLRSPTGLLDDELSDLLIADQVLAFPNAPVNIAESPDTSMFQFLEIGFYLCTKQLETRVSKGISETHELSSSGALAKPSPQGLNHMWAQNFTSCYLAGTCNSTIGGMTAVLEGPSPTTADKPRVYTVDVWTALAASKLLSDVMTDATLLDSFRGHVSSMGGGVGHAFASGVFGPFRSSAMPDAKEQMAAVRTISENIARSCTNFVRLLTYTGDTGPAQVRGTAFASQIFVRIRWPWLALLAAQLLLTSLFLIAVITESAALRVRAMKSSTVAAMVALRPDAKAQLGNIADIQGVAKNAKTLKVYLERGEDGKVLGLSSQEIGLPLGPVGEDSPIF